MTSDGSGGQVSETAALGDPDEPISPEDATAGYPGGESGQPDEDAAGPDAVPRENQQDGPPDGDASE